MFIGKPIYECVTAPASIVTLLFTARLRAQGLAQLPRHVPLLLSFDSPVLGTLSEARSPAPKSLKPKAIPSKSISP